MHSHPQPSKENARYPREECGVFGVINHPEASHLTALGLFALQHRGEEAAGIVSSDGKNLFFKGALGQVNAVFNQESIRELPGRAAIGHNRYSITGSSVHYNVQPLFIRSHFKGGFALCHNGNITNAKKLRLELEQKGAAFQTSMDSEIFLHLIIHAKAKSIKDSIVEAVKQVQGAFSLLVMTKGNLYALRDNYGFRPLCLGDLGGAKVVASETCALDLVGAKYKGQVHPGELITIGSKGEVQTERYMKADVAEHKCIFELVYFSRPDSLTFGESVYQFRKNLGKILAQETPVPEADFVTPVPDSGLYSAMGYAEESNLPFEMSITRNHYVGRSFIQPNQSTRESFVNLKLNPIKNLIHKKRIVLIDDSIVRGTTTRRKIKSLRDTGAKEVHMRIACPPLKHSCYYGVDFPNNSELIANAKSIEAITKFLGLDSLAYLSVEGLLRASVRDGFCTACFTGNYPTPIDNGFNKNYLEA